MRSVADSNRCSWFCRPVTKPLIQPTILKWYHQESNRGHKDFQSFALPTELWHHYCVRRMRLELTQPNGHYPLKVACLPISPPPQNKLLSEKRDSNPRPRPWQGRALPTELFSQVCGAYGTRTRDPMRDRHVF